MKIKLLTNEEFLEFSKKFKPSSMYQTTYYAFTMNNQEYDSMFVGLMDGNVLKAASLILVSKINGFKYAMAPRGLLVDYNDEDLLKKFTILLKKFLGKQNIVAIKISPMIMRKVYGPDKRVISHNGLYDSTFQILTKLGYFHLGYNNYFEALKPRFEAFLNLELSFIQLFANIDKSFRNKIRKAERDGIKVYHGNIDDLKYLYFQTKEKYPRDLKYFKDIYNFFDKDGLVDFYYSKLDTTDYLKYTQDKYNELYKKSNEISNKLIKYKGNNTKLINDKLNVDKLLAKYRKQLAKATDYLKNFPHGIILSSALIIKWQDEVYLLNDGYDEKYKSFGAKHLMLWKLMVRYSKLGFKKFNLGGVSNINQINNKYKGLNEFKLNFHCNVVEYIGDFELITNSPLYFAYKNSFGITTIFNKKNWSY